MRRRHFITGASGIPLVLESMKGQAAPRRGSPRDPMESATSPGTFSHSRLGRFHDIMAGYVERGDVPGVVTLVSRPGDVHVDSIGHTALGGKDAMRRDTVFRIASMTKPVTAAAAMILVEECRLRLDESVNRLLPELADRRVLKRIDGPLDDTVAAKRPITLRDLLTFRMGIGLAVGSQAAYPIAKAMQEQNVAVGPHLSDAKGSGDWIRGLGKLPLMFQPGEKWMYHTGSDVLGVLIERASGQPLRTFLRHRLFEPLGMKDTDFSVPEEKKARLAGCYVIDSQTGKLTAFESQDRWSRPVGFQSGGGGLVSTVDDYWSFSRMMLNKGRIGNDRLLSKASVELMTADQLTPEQKAGSGFFPG